MQKMKMLLSLLCCLGVMSFSLQPLQAQTTEEWIELGHRVHGGFGSYLILGIRIGLNARQVLKASPRDLDVTYYDGPNAPCACVADGLMLATGTSPGQSSLRVAQSKSAKGTFGVAVIKNRRSGQSLSYEIPASARGLLDSWNQDSESERFEKVMNAPESQLFKLQSSQP